MNRIDQELIEAAKENNLPAVHRLLRAEADVNTKDNHGWVPLHWVSCRGHVQAVKELREHGADTDAKDSFGIKPLHLLCSQGHLAVVNELLSPDQLLVYSASARVAERTLKRQILKATLL
jgi:ankyrin repeat protein